MTDTSVPNRIFPKAKDDANAAAQVQHVVPQTSDPAYRLAYQDPDFLLRDDLRPVRFQLELMKPELLQEEAGIGSTFVMYGSARIPSPEQADAIVAAAKTDTQRHIADRLKAKSHYYDVARELAQLASKVPVGADGKRQFVVCSGGGPAIMNIGKLGGLTPRSIRTHLGLNKPIYQKTAAYGHFGRKAEGDFFPWERLDLVEYLKAAL